MKKFKNIKLHNAIICLLLAALLCFFSACSLFDKDTGKLPGTNDENPSDVRANFLNSITKMEAFSGGDGAAAQRDIQAFLKKFEEEVSIAIETSDIAILNNAPAGQSIKLGEHAYKLVKMAVDTYKLSDGAFNPFLVRLSEVWGFPPLGSKMRVPTEEEITAALLHATPEADNVFAFSDADSTVTKLDGDVMVDLGAIAKGYALEKSRDIAVSHGVTSGRINLGGNIYAIGNKTDGTPHLIGITDPRWRTNGNEKDYFAVAHLKDTSISASGDYERYFIHEDKRYCHIFDGRTGLPVDNGVTSVVVIMADGALADAYSTAAMVKGAQEGLKFLQDNNIDAMIITKEMQYYLSGNISSILTNIRIYSPADID